MVIVNYVSFRYIICRMAWLLCIRWLRSGQNSILAKLKVSVIFYLWLIVKILTPSSHSYVCMSIFIFNDPCWIDFFLFVIYVVLCYIEVAKYKKLQCVNYSNKEAWIEILEQQVVIRIVLSREKQNNLSFIGKISKQHQQYDDSKVPNDQKKFLFECLWMLSLLIFLSSSLIHLNIKFKVPND